MVTVVTSKQDKIAEAMQTLKATVKVWNFRQEDGTLGRDTPLYQWGSAEGWHTEGELLRAASILQALDTREANRGR